MTIQTRTLISLSDLIGMEYECTHCHVKYSVPLQKLDRPTLACPNCKEQWFDHPRGPAVDVSEDALQHFVDCLRFLQARQLPGVALRLEIKTTGDSQ